MRGDVMLLADLRRTYEMTEGGRARKLLVCARSPGVHAVIVLRFGQWLLRRNLLLRIPGEPLYQLLSTLVQILWGIEIPRRAKIGPGLYIGHFGGITVAADAVIGRNCNLSQQVTIGVSGEGALSGAPVIGDNVYIAPGARLFGRISVGNNVKIGANAVIHRDVPDRAIAVMDPGFKIIS
jgi:serine O-acetyltransferase